jgi:putative ABC transport system permease protein
VTTAAPPGDGGARGRLRQLWTVACGTGTAASIGLALLVLGTVFTAMAIPRAGQGLRTDALRRTIAGQPASSTAVLGSLAYQTFDVAFFGRPFGAAQFAATPRELSGNLTRLGLPAVASGAWAGLTSGYSVVGGAGPRAKPGGIPPRMKIVYRDQLARNTRLISGRLPVLGPAFRRRIVLQVAVTPATAARFGLRPGSQLSYGSGVFLVVTGIIRPAGPDSAFWTTDPIVATPEEETSPAPGLIKYWIGAAFISPAELTLLQTSLPTGPMRVSWAVPLSTARLTAGQVPAMKARLLAAVSTAGTLITSTNKVPTNVLLSSGLLVVLAAFLAEDQASGSVLSLLSVSLAVIGIVTVLLGTGLVAARRREEFTLLRARGSSLRQVAALALAAAAILALPASVAGGLLAIILVTPGGGVPAAWWLAGATLAAALAGLPLIAVGLQRGAARRAVGGTAPRRGAAARRLVAEVALAAVAVGGIVVLRRQGLTAGGLNAYASAAPVLVALLAAIVVVRGYPAVLRLGLRLARARPGVSALVGLARATRTSASAVVPVFALVLALAVVAFGTMLGDAVHRGQVAQSWREVGADAVIQASASSRPLTAAAEHSIAAAAGPVRTATVAVTAGALRPGPQVTVAVLDPSRYAALVADTPGPAFPASALARPPAGPGPVPVLAAATVAGAVPGHTATLQIGTRRLTVRLAGQVRSVPGVGAGALVVLPAWALGNRPPPTVMLVAGPHVDGTGLTAAVRRALPGAPVILRSDVLAALARAPLPDAATHAIAESAAAAALFSALIVLISLLMSAPSRDMTLTRLATMGLGRGQARRLVLVETLPLVLAATAGGVASAWALAPLVAPSISLASLTGSGAGVPVRIEPLPLAACAGGLVLLAAGVLAAQFVIARRRGVARALRVGD